ncbi:lipase family protein [Pelagibaculum spongiae]|uniref:Fungal lipase-type domain-containing protein n=1 Tax=Pelagibaculum spongiae TaxID=2080658 RepID=A0A2V1GXB8_9GAMM|nr:lipase family protein [Pelagibaculum spongiae]PVZ66345.1 hypothetical protein DC094_16745 [Pelagibaculum spongiae]
MPDSKYFNEASLLTPPSQRSAYSDRMAYVCAELARLAYFPFEGGATAERLLSQVEKALKEVKVDTKTANAVKQRVTAHLAQDKLDAASSLAVFKETLLLGGFELIDTFGAGDTQGFLCRRDSTIGKGTAFLVYRGTESFNDVIDDLNVFLTREPFKGTDDDESLVHKGFYKQFSDVNELVKGLLEKVEDHQLMITGHSLGGALAVLATRFYAKDSSGACYTYGAPAVGNPAFQWPIKTPIYRIVNEVDPVARVPSAYTGFMVQFLAHWLHKFLGLFGVERSKAADQIIHDLKLYRQNGYESYLLPKNGQIMLRVGGSLDLIDRFKFWFNKFSSKAGLRKVADYHGIDHYVERLKQWAKSRNISEIAKQPITTPDWVATEKKEAVKET